MEYLFNQILIKIIIIKIFNNIGSQSIGLLVIGIEDYWLLLL